MKWNAIIVVTFRRFFQSGRSDHFMLNVKILQIGKLVGKVSPFLLSHTYSDFKFSQPNFRKRPPLFSFKILLDRKKRFKAQRVHPLGFFRYFEIEKVII